MSLTNRSFLKLLDYTPAEIEELLDLAALLKAKKKAGIRHNDQLAGKNIALIFEKTSTRTRCSFEVAVKRPVQIEDLEKMVEDIVQELKNQFRREVTSDEIGELVLRRLKDIDKVAYIRFASVYRDFNDIDSFVRIISELNDEK